MEDKLITLAIHTDEKAFILKNALENEGIEVFFDGINIENPEVSSGVRVRIKEKDLPRALDIVENRHLYKNKKKSTRTSENDKRILVPVDFSDYSMKACQFAFNLANEINAKVKILHIYFNPFYPSDMPLTDIFSMEGKDNQSFGSIVAKVKEDMKVLCSRIDSQVSNGVFPQVNYSYVLKEGLPEEEIVSFSKEYEPDFIVMGTRGKNQKDIDLIGSVTAEVIDRAQIPVIAIPENTHFSDFNQVKNVSFFTNFTQRDLIAFEQMMRVFKDTRPKIFLSHITSQKKTWDEIKLQGVISYFKKQYPELEFEYQFLKTDDLIEDVEKFTRSKHIDVLVLTASKRNIFARLFNPSIARKVLFHSDTPLFVLRG